MRLLLTLAHNHSLESRSIDFVLAFPQAALNIEVYMEILFGFEYYYDRDLHVLRLKRSIYSLKQSNYNFYKKLSAALEAYKIFPCSSNRCVYVSKNLILVVYINDILIFSKEKIWIDIFVKLLFKGDEKFELTDEGSIDKYLGLKIAEKQDRTYKLKQPYLIKYIIDELNLSVIDFLYVCLVL